MFCQVTKEMIAETIKYLLVKSMMNLMMKVEVQVKREMNCFIRIMHWGCKLQNKNPRESTKNRDNKPHQK